MYSTENKFTGWWWLPKKPDEQIPGTLVYSENGITLSTQGLFKESQDLFHKSMWREIEIIHGFAKCDKTGKSFEFTLIDNWIKTYDFGKLIDCSFGSKYIIKNIHFSTIKEIKFNTVFIKTKLLDDWVNKHGFNVTPNFNKFSVTIDYKQPESIEILKTDKYKFYLYFRANAPIFITDKASITQSIYFNIEFKRQNKLDSTLDLMEQIRDLFSFMISHPVKITEFDFQVYSKNTLKRKGLRNQKTGSFFYLQRIQETQRERFNQSDMLIGFKDIENNVGEIIKAWLSMYNHKEPVLKLYFNTIYNPDLYSEYAFLNFISALEFYHRNTFTDFKPKESKRYHKQINRIISQIKSRNDQEFLIARLNRIPETHLIRRLNDLLDKNPIITEMLIKNKQFFLKRIVKTRHAFVHYNVEPSEKKYIIKHGHLIEYIEKLKIFIEIIILKDLGFSDEKVKKLIKKPLHNNKYLR